MALRNLAVSEMVEISGAWVAEDNAAHQAILTVPELSGLTPRLVATHQDLETIVPTEDNPRAQEIVALAAEQDVIHDTLARGIFGYLTETALLDDDGESLLELRNLLFPDGIAAAIRATYRGEAGYARLLRQRITPAMRKVLTKLSLRRGNLMDRVTAWLDAGDRLGALEEERARLATTTDPTLAGQVLSARNAWIRAVNAFVAVADLTDLDPELDRTIFGPLRDAEATADARAARRSAGDVATVVATDLEGDGTPT